MQLSALGVGYTEEFRGKWDGLLQILLKSCMAAQTDHRGIGLAQCWYGNNAGYTTEAGGEDEDVTKSDALGDEAACDWPQAWSLGARQWNTRIGKRLRFTKQWPKDIQCHGCTTLMRGEEVADRS